MMRTRQTFLLTVIKPENDPASLRGRLKVIASGKSYNFTSMDELNRLITAEMEEGDDRAANGLDFPLNASPKPASSD